MGLLSVVAILLIEGLQSVKEGHALACVPGGHLGEHQGSGNGVLIADIVAQHIAVGLLVGEDDLALTGGFQSILLLGHELEAGEGVKAGDAVALGHLAGHLGGDDGLDGNGILGQSAGTLHGADEVIQQQNTGLVAGDGAELAGLVPDHDAHAVTVGVGAQHKVHIVFLCKVNGKIEALGIFGVGGFYGGEVTVDDHLLGLADQVLDAQSLQCLGNQLVAAAVEGGVDHLEGVSHLGNGLAVVDHVGDLGHKEAVSLLTHDLDQAGLHALLVGHGLDVVEDIHFLQTLGNGVGVLGRKLGAILPVDLVAVVLLGVVAGGNIDTGLAVVGTNGKAQLRGGTQRLKDTHMDAVGGAHLSGSLGKGVGVVAAVHADGDAPALALLTLGGDHIGKALSRPADHMDVHVMQAHGHNTAQTCGAELQRAVEAGLDLLGVVLDGLQLCTLRVGKDGAGEPLFIFLHEIHS